MAGPAGVYLSPTFSPDGRSVAAVNGAFDGATVVTVWDVATGSERFSFEPAGAVSAVTYHPDGTSLLVTDTDANRIVFHSADDGRELTAFATPGFVPEAVFVDPSGTRVAIKSETSGGVQIWDLASREPLRTIPVDDAFVVDWSADGERVAVGSGNQGPVRVIDVVFRAGDHGAAWSRDGCIRRRVRRERPPGERRWRSSGVERQRRRARRPRCDQQRDRSPIRVRDRPRRVGGGDDDDRGRRRDRAVRCPVRATGPPAAHRSVRTTARLNQP